MGVLNRVKNWLSTTGVKTINGIKQGISTGYNSVKGIAHTIGTVADGVDKFLTNAKDIPVIGRVADLIKDNGIYSEAQKIIKEGVQAVDDVGKVGSAINKVITPVINALGDKSSVQTSPGGGTM